MAWPHNRWGGEFIAHSRDASNVLIEFEVKPQHFFYHPVTFHPPVPAIIVDNSLKE